jgi:hypothetical protein
VTRHRFSEVDVHHRFPEEVADSSGVFRFAELPGTASGENPAPGIGARSAFNGTTTTISFL